MGTFFVVVPCYNYARYLRECVESVLTQDGVDVRVLVIDDCSQDDTEAVGRRLAAEDGRVRFIRHAGNKGHIATYNEGIGLAEGDYFILLSADDLLMPGALARAAAIFEKHPSVGLVYGFARPLYGDERKPAVTSTSGMTIWKGRDWIGRICRSGKNFIISPEAILRMDIMKRLGGYDPALPHSGDMEIWLRAASHADVGHVDGAEQAYYRVHGANMHSTLHAGHLFDLQSRRDALVSAFAKDAGRLPDAPALLAAARQALAAEAIRSIARLLDKGQASDDLVARYRNFARSLHPHIMLTRQWRSLARRGAGHGPVSSVLTAARDLIYRITFKLAWRRWWRTGVY